MIFIDTSAFVAVLANEPERDGFLEAIEAADRRLASPVVRLETCIVLSRRLDFSPQAAEARYNLFLEEAGVSEIEMGGDVAIGLDRLGARAERRFVGRQLVNPRDARRAALARHVRLDGEHARAGGWTLGLRYRHLLWTVRCAWSAQPLGFSARLEPPGHRR